ncbi:hypothetical protein [Halosimplex amylolyticum]|uniref:hypothetical protein n=1 Tax=Halosimplex amylolyticum TaxID=3396616 RepID=UPI003F549FEB
MLTDGGQERFVDTLEGVEKGGQRAARLQRKLDDEDFGAVFNADLPDETRGTLLRAYDDGDLSASETATVARKLDEPGNSDVVSTIRTLDETDQRRAFELIGETGDNGVTLISSVDTPATRDLLRIDTGEIDAVRNSLARSLSSGSIDADTVEQFAEDAAELERRGVDGLADGPIKDIARTGDPSNIPDAAFEARSAVKLLEDGSDIDEIGKKVILSDDRRVEFDIVQSNGDLAEVKNGDFTRASGGDVRKLRSQIEDNYLQYRDSSSDTMTVVFSDPIEEIDEDVLDMLDNLDDKYGNVDYQYVPRTE